MTNLNAGLGAFRYFLNEGIDRNKARDAASIISRDSLGDRTESEQRLITEVWNQIAPKGENPMPDDEPIEVVAYTIEYESEDDDEDDELIQNVLSAFEDYSLIELEILTDVME